MNEWTLDYRDEDNHEKKNRILPMMRTYLLAALLLVPSLPTQSEDIIDRQQGISVWIGDEKDPTKESVEVGVSYEVILKNGIKKALNWMDTLSDIPTGGKRLEYYRNEWSLKGKKLSPESIKKLNLPEVIDINPRTINAPISSMTFTIGNRKFDIAPDICDIKKISLTKEALVIETTLLFVLTYNKSKRLPDLMYRLWMCPKWKWEKEWFRATTVTEI
jgi:hypothetical protein